MSIVFNFVRKHNPVSTYVLTLKFMHGDADFYSSEEYFFKTHEEERVKSLISKLNKLKRYYRPDYSWNDNDDKVIKFENKELAEIFGEKWPFDDPNRCDEFAAYAGFSLTFFDENGVEFDVLWCEAP